MWKKEEEEEEEEEAEENEEEKEEEEEEEKRFTLGQREGMWMATKFRRRGEEAFSTKQRCGRLRGWREVGW